MINFLKGRSRKLILPNGEEHSAFYAIVDLNDIKASHNEVTFSDTIGYPIENGRNINDRNYKDDIAAQRNVQKIAENLNPETLISLSSTPSGTPIINKDGIVVSGNNRVMSLKLALKQYPENYEKYKNQLSEDLGVFGFSFENLDNIKFQKNLSEYIEEAKKLIESGKLEIRYDKIKSGYNKGAYMAIIENTDFFNPFITSTERISTGTVDGGKESALNRLPRLLAEYLYRVEDKSYLKLKHPILVRIDESLPEKLTTEILAAYNQDTKKGERPVDRAIKLSSILKTNDRCRNVIVTIIDGYETFSDLYSSQGRNDRKKLIDTLVQCGLITEAQLPIYFENGEFTENGKDFIETILSAIILDADALKVLGAAGVKAYRQTLISSLPVLISNEALKDGSLKNDINDAIIIQYKIAQNGGSFSDYTHSQSLFAEDKPSEKGLILNSLLRSGKNTFKAAIKKYTESVKSNEGVSMFGDNISVDEIFEKTIKSQIDPSDKKNIEMLYVGSKKPSPTQEKQMEKQIKSGKLKLSDIPANVKKFMPEMQQKAIVGSEEHWEILSELSDIINKMPKTYQTTKIDTDEKIVYLHYFFGDSDWFIVEKDKEPEQYQAYGYAILNGDYQNAEWGYIDIEALKATNKVELDFFFEPIKFGELKKTFDEDEYVIYKKGETPQDDRKKMEKFILAVYPKIIDDFGLKYPNRIDEISYQSLKEAYQKASSDFLEIDKELSKEEIANFINKISDGTKESKDFEIENYLKFNDRTVEGIMSYVFDQYNSTEKTDDFFSKLGYKGVIYQDGDHRLFKQSEPNKADLKHEIDLTPYRGKGWDAALSVKAFETFDDGNRLMFTQYTPSNHILGIHDAEKRKVFKKGYEKALELGYVVKSYKAGKYGVVYVFEKDNKALTEKYFNELGSITPQQVNSVDVKIVSEEEIPYNTISEFNEAVFNQIIPHDDWEGNLMKERALKRDLKSIVKDATPEDIEELFADYKVWFNSKKKNQSTKEETKIEQKEFRYYKGVDFAYKNAFEFNKAVEELLDENKPNYTPEEKVFMSNYSGYGGLEKFGAEGKGLLYEYFTPRLIVEKMWGLAYKYGFNGGSILEPSCGVGEFIKFSPDKSLVTGYEINPYSAKIAHILYPESKIIQQSFETIFIKNNESVKNKIDNLKKYNLIIGNPPYGDFEGRYAGMGERSYTKAENYIDYFITRGLDLLEKGGLLIMIIGAEVASGGKLFLQKGNYKCKQDIMEKSILLDAYRLPNGVFERTDVLSDIIILKKI